MRVQPLSGNSLEKRIDLLFKNGNISNSDKKRLHAIRFLGNDAAHDIREPKRSELRVALEIVEHLIKSVFILEKRAEDLETSIETLDEFVPVIRTCAKKFSPETVHTLLAILGKQLRRVGGDFPQLEALLITQIKAGEINFLALDSVQEHDKKSVQLYRIVPETFDDDLPY